MRVRAKLVLQVASVAVVALLIGLTDLKDREVQAPQKTSNDIVAMQEALKQLGLKPHVVLIGPAGFRSGQVIAGPG